MKKLNLFCMLAICLMVFSCSKDKKTTDNNNNNNNNNSGGGQVCATCNQKPQAVAAEDNSSGGVYKGVLVGSSGTVILYLDNGDTTVKMLISFDGHSATLTTASLSSWHPGQPISNAAFSGKGDDGTPVSATFSVDANGANPTLSFSITGHAVQVGVYKETSTTLVKSFQGIATPVSDPNEKHDFNVAFFGDQYTLVDKNGIVIKTTLIDGKIDFVVKDAKVQGNFNGSDYISGTWTNSTDNGTWYAKRTL